MYRLRRRTYSTYWDLFTPQEWEEEKTDYAVLARSWPCPSRTLLRHLHRLDDAHESLGFVDRLESQPR